MANKISHNRSKSRAGSFSASLVFDSGFRAGLLSASQNQAIERNIRTVSHKLENKTNGNFSRGSCRSIVLTKASKQTYSTANKIRDAVKKFEAKINSNRS